MSVGQKTIFLVDDDVTNLVAGDVTLSRLYKTFTMNSGFLLLKMLERNIPDLILLDVEMPEMSGYETIEILKKREETRNIPVIFLTAHNDTESELKGLSLGAVDYIIKPFSPPLLLKRIEVHLLVESQKKQLINFNNNLQIMVDTKTKTVVELKNAFLRTIAEMVEWRDGTTGEHIGRTEFYVEILLNELEKNDLYKNEVQLWDKELILQSAQLHDVGKIAIKDNILKKPARLTNDEFQEIKTHVEFGVMVIERIKQKTIERSFLEQASIFIATHHEKWDGSGYPRGLKGKEIPLQGRLMAIADVYDALTSVRPYKKAYTHEEACSMIIADSGTHFDPLLVEVFKEVKDEFQRAAESNS